MNRIKVQFLSGAFRTITFDEMHLNGPFVILNLAGQTQLTNLRGAKFVLFEAALPEPEKASRREAAVGLLFR